MQATSMFGMGMIEALILMLFSGGIGVPLGVPPEPEDVLLARVAPEECLFYTTWSGMASPDAASGNQTEQLLAEPEVQHLFRELEVRITQGLQAMSEGGRDPSGAVMAELMPKLGKALLTRPTAVFVSSVQPKPGGVDVHGGMLVNVGENVAEIRVALEKLQRQSIGDAAKTVEIAESTFYQFQPGEDAPLITWGTKGRYLVVGIGAGAVEGMFERARTEPPKWLTETRAKLAVERTSTVTYLNVAKIIDQAAPLGGPQVQDVIDTLGFGNLKSYSSVTGLDKTGFVSRSSLEINGQPAGLLRIIDSPPLTPADLQRVPHGTVLATALKLDVGKLLDSVLEAAGQIDPDARDEIIDGLQGTERLFGVKLREDLLGSLGDVWCVYTAPSDGGLLTGWTFSVQVRDRHRLQQVHDRLVRFARAGFADEEGAPQIKQLSFNGQEIFYLDVPDADMPVTPSWCLTDKELLFGLFPQTIKSHLSRGAAEKSLADVPEVARQFQNGDGPLLLSYYDSQKLFHVIYPLLQMAAQFGLAEAQRQGADIDISILPSSASIEKHLRPAVTVVRRTKEGVTIESQQSLPSGGFGATAPVTIALILPAVQAAREAARRTESVNNLRQIGLALHTYHDVYRGFPAAYNTDKDGKPLLSWRVHILPFIEETNLYERFHFDEPWDSEHNRQLIAHMPKAYQAPGSNAGPGKTNYLGAFGKTATFVAPKDADKGQKSPRGTSMAEMRDGTSNTIIAVEVSDPAAVIWTKPDDFQPDDENPLKGLVGLRSGGFNALLGDGSVRFISQTVDAKLLKALFTRDGGEIVSDLDRR
jgi:hypothetical protein